MKVITIEAVTVGDRHVPPGETIDLAKDKAERLIEMGAVKAAPASKPDKES